MNETKFSIVIPTFNREDFLVDALQSVVASRPVNAEIIVVNDGDALSNNTLNLIEKFSARVVNTTGSVGAGATRNLGVRNASGDWILFLDDDDMIRCGYWDQLAKFLILHTADSLVYGFCTSLKSANRSKLAKYSATRGKFIFRQEVGNPRKRLSGLGMGFFISRSLYLSVGGLDPFLKVNEDTDLCVRLLAVGAKCLACAEPGVAVFAGSHLHRVRSTTKKYDATERAGFFLKIIQENVEYLRSDKSVSKWLMSRYLKLAADSGKPIDTIIEKLNFNWYTILVLKLFYSLNCFTRRVRELLQSFKCKHES